MFDLSTRPKAVRRANASDGYFWFSDLVLSITRTQKAGKLQIPLWHYRITLSGALLTGLSLVGCLQQKPIARPSIDQIAHETFAGANDLRMNAELQAAANSSADKIIYANPNRTGGPTGEWLVPLPTLDGASDFAPVLSQPITSQFELVEGDYVETPLREVLSELTELAGAELVMDESVNGVVNLRFERTTIDEAIERVLLAHPFYHVRKGRQFIIAPADTESPLFSHIAVRHEYRPRHLEPAALLATVPAGAARFVTTIDGANTLLVEAPDRIARPILERFAAIDRPIPQVALEAIICVIAPDSGHRFGLDWKHAVELNNQNAFRLGVTGLGLGLDVTQSGVGEVFGDFAKTTAFVQALSEYGYLTIRAAPHVMAQDGEQATISIQRETFFSIQPPAAAGGDSSAFFFQQDMQNVESGITLDIVPRIHRDQVTIKIEKAEVSEDIRTASAEAALNPFPIINRRSVSTTVTVRDGKTIVIGGLVQRETVDRESLIPGLGRIPVIGNLFKTTEQQTRNAEIVIFLSPRIVKPSVEDDYLDRLDF